MAFHLKNLKTQKDKFFLSMGAQQLCDMLNDGEIMNYINTIPHRRDEIANIFASMGDSCNMRKVMPIGIRQKKLAPLVVQLSKIIKEYEMKKVQIASNLVETQRKQKEAANLAMAAQAEANRKAAENSQREANARMAEEAAKAAKNAANAQLKNAEATIATAVANVSGQVTQYENSMLTKELTNIKKNINALTSRLNKAIQNSRNATRRNIAPAARKGGARKNTCKRK